MKFLPAIRLVCWAACMVLMVMSVLGMGNSVIGGLLMLSGTLCLCPASWRAMESLSGKKGSGMRVAILAAPLLLLGVGISLNAGDPGTPLRLLTDADVVDESDARPHPEVNLGALNFFRHIMEEDYLVALSGGESALSSLSMVSPVERLPSSLLARLYEDEDAARGASYKGRRLIVSGEILAVRVDFANDVIVELPGADELFHVQAKLHSDPRKFPGPVMQGNHVDLYCTVLGKVSADSVGNLYLKDCTGVDFRPDARAYADNLTEALSGWLHTGGKHIFPSDNAAAYFLATYLSGTRLPSSNPCLRKETSLEECVSSLDGMQPSALFEAARSDLLRWQEWLGVPMPGDPVQLSGR